MCVCMYTYIYIYAHIRICIHVHIYTRTLTLTRTVIYTYIRTCMCVYLSATELDRLTAVVSWPKMLVLRPRWSYLPVFQINEDSPDADHQALIVVAIVREWRAASWRWLCSFIPILVRQRTCWPWLVSPRFLG